MRILNYIFLARVSKKEANQFFISLVKEERDNFSDNKEEFIAQIKKELQSFKESNFIYSKANLKDSDIIKLF